jgi:hypothetical protein
MKNEKEHRCQLGFSQYLVTAHAGISGVRNIMAGATRLWSTPLMVTTQSIDFWFRETAGLNVNKRKRKFTMNAQRLSPILGQSSQHYGTLIRYVITHCSSGTSRHSQQDSSGPAKERQKGNKKEKGKRIDNSGCRFPYNYNCRRKFSKVK